MDLSVQQQALLDDIEQKFHVKDHQLDSLLQGFIHDMKAGLDPSSMEKSDLKMIPSYVTGKSSRRTRTNTHTLKKDFA
jgi:hexokinase